MEGSQKEGLLDSTECGCQKDSSSGKDAWRQVGWSNERTQAFPKQQLSINVHPSFTPGGDLLRDWAAWGDSAPPWG